MPRDGSAGVSAMLDAIVDEATAADRRWFLSNPRRQYRVRGFVPGEMPVSMPMGDGVAVTVLRQIGRGVRVRLPLYVQRLPPDTETDARRLFQIALGRQP